MVKGRVLTMIDCIERDKVLEFIKESIKEAEAEYIKSECTCTDDFIDGWVSGLQDIETMSRKIYLPPTFAPKGADILYGEKDTEAVLELQNVYLILVIASLLPLASTLLKLMKDVLLMNRIARNAASF